MNQFKQNLWVVSILFLSLSSSVALCYAITPATAMPVAKAIKTDMPCVTTTTMNQKIIKVSYEAEVYK